MVEWFCRRKFPIPCQVLDSHLFLFQNETTHSPVFRNYNPSDESLKELRKEKTIPAAGDLFRSLPPAIKL